MTKTTPTPALVAYEANPTATNTETGAVETLNPREYATGAACDAVVAFLKSDPRTSAWGPFSVVSVDQSGFPWQYSVPCRQVAIGNGTEFDGALWYEAIANNYGPLVQSYINEMGEYATGQDQEEHF